MRKALEAIGKPPKSSGDGINFKYMGVESDSEGSQQSLREYSHLFSIVRLDRYLTRQEVIRGVWERM